MKKLERRKRRIVLLLILSGCAGWFALGWTLIIQHWNLGASLIALSCSGAALALDGYANPRGWRWLI